MGLRIAQVAPLWERVPPVRYGAVEYLVGVLTESLKALGHEVTLFASADSITSARLVPGSRAALNNSQSIKEPEIYRILQLEAVRALCTDFDIIHSHVHSNSGCLAIPMLSGIDCPVIHTIHCFANEDNRPLFGMYAKENYASISHDQPRHFPAINLVANVHHGIDVGQFPFKEQPEEPEYLALLGRIRPEKGVHSAIRVALQAGVRLKIAGRIKPADKEYFVEQVLPHIDGDAVQYVGELGFREKTDLLAGAKALLFPITFNEPFGLVLIEAMACGCPVVALNYGAVGEIVVNNETGFILDSLGEMVEAVGRVGTLSRRVCRDHIERHFSSERMACQYSDAYSRVLGL